MTLMLLRQMHDLSSVQEPAFPGVSLVSGRRRLLLPALRPPRIPVGHDSAAKL